eukprot:g486.t1
MSAFLEMHRVTPEEVLFAHSIYFVWNTLNDLLGGWIVYKYNERYGSRLSLATMLSLGFALSGALPFFYIPALSPGVHYFIALSLADGFMSVRAIALGAMVEEVAIDDSHQICITRYDMAFGVLEFAVKSLGFFLFDPQDMLWFQMFTIGLVAFSVASALLAEAKLRPLLLRRGRAYKRLSDDEADEIDAVATDKKVSAAVDDKTVAQSPAIVDDELSLKCVGSFASTVAVFFRCVDFRAFVGASVVDEAYRSFNAQFRPVLVDALLTGYSDTHLAIAKTSLVVVGDLWKFVAVNVADVIGVVEVVRVSFLCKCAFPLLVGATLAALRAFFFQASIASIDILVGALLVQLVTELTLQSGPGAFFSLFMARLSAPVRTAVFDARESQQSQQQRRRGRGRSENKATTTSFLSLMWSTHALIAKPLTSVGPIIGTYVLASDDGTSTPREKFRRAALIVFAFPVVVGLVQRLVFEAYRLKHR